MEAYSIDLRERVVAVCDEGTETREETAQRLCVSTSFIRKLLRRRRQSGSIAPKPHAGGGRPSLEKADLQQVRRLVEQKPDATLAELCQRLAAHAGRRVRGWTMCRALQKLKLPRKKSRYMPASGTRHAFRSCVGLGLRRSSESRPGS
jgi:transposase